ncbi:MAG: YabP/YqfC family sporulation protein, partial [Clostridium paraputrificum]
MEEKINKGREMLVDKFDLPAEIVMDIPKIIITGNKEITIENHKGISNFEKNLIKVNS